MQNRRVSDNSRIQALSVMKDVVKMKMDILTNTTTLSQALEFIEDRKSEIKKYSEDIGKIASEDHYCSLCLITFQRGVLVG
jgi:dTDP-D-glucose 4,6-dehydratase